jgi:hypothetical protein
MHNMGFEDQDPQLILTSHDLLKSLDNNIQMDLIVMDFSKAFDKVPHNRLLHKADFYGIRGNTLEWIRSFLSNRTQKVVLEGEHSEEVPVSSGVPQGTVMGPILFLIFINDLPEGLTSTVRLFADDCVIYRQIKSSDDCKQLQRDLDHLFLWETTWQMKFHANKCHRLSIHHKSKPWSTEYTLGGSVLSEVKQHPYLGLELQSDGYWKHHIGTTIAKGGRALGLLRRNLRSAPQHLKATAYKTIVRPRLEYACTVWDPHLQNLTNSLEKVQRRAARFVCKNYCYDASVTQMLVQLGWQPLDIRRMTYRLVMMYKIVNNAVAIPAGQYLIPVTSTTRASSHTYQQQHCNRNYYLYSYFPRTTVEWNWLPQVVASAPSLEAFKTSLQTVDLASIKY